MAVFKCKICGGNLEVQEGMSVCECEYCGTRQTLPKMNDERRLNLYDRANHFRRNNEFDKAISMYEQILQEDKEDAEAYWSLVLCTYGIEYVEDPATHTRKPTVNRTQYTSVFADENYKAALRYADESQKAIYEAEAKQIDEIQKGILDISGREEPFDVFICYKESDAAGKRTPDSVLANDLYHQLTQEGFKVFFARITLEDKLGSAYEPYIFAALNSAKVMVVLGTKPEYFQAVWVRNEWSRYLNMIKKGEKKVLIPAYKDMDPYDLPQEFSHLQAQDMGKLGFMQDLIRGIRKLTGADERTQAVTSAGGTGKETGALLKRAFMFLEDGDFAKADEYSEQVLNMDPENGEAYLGKLMVQCRVRKREELAQCAGRLDVADAFRKVMRFGGETLRTEVEGYNQQILEAAYQKALQLLNTAGNSRQLQEVIRHLQELGEYKDAAAQIKLAKEKLEKVSRKEQAKRKRGIRLAVAAAVVVVGLIFVTVVSVRIVQNMRAMEDLEMGDYDRAYSSLEDLFGREKAREQVCSAISTELNACVEAGSFSDAVDLLASLYDYKDDCTEEICQVEMAMCLGIQKNIEEGEYDAAVQNFESMVDPDLPALGIMQEEVVQLRNVILQTRLQCMQQGRDDDVEKVDSLLPLLYQLCQNWGINSDEQQLRNNLIMASLGDQITFGRLNGWTVEEISPDGTILLVTRNGYLNTPNEDSPYSWEKSEVREWLNNDFFIQTFDFKEKALIVNSTLTNHLYSYKREATVSQSSYDRSELEIFQMEDTVDKIFLLSVDELEELVGWVPAATRDAIVQQVADVNSHEDYQVVLWIESESNRVRGKNRTFTDSDSDEGAVIGLRVNPYLE